MNVNKYLIKSESLIINRGILLTNMAINILSISRSKVGNYSWVLGHDCKCGANISPAFVLDMTGLIFKTGGRHLHTRGPGSDRRQPVVV